MKTTPPIARYKVDDENAGLSTPAVSPHALRYERQIRCWIKMFTMWAYSHGYVSFLIVQRIFAQFDLRDV